MNTTHVYYSFIFIKTFNFIVLNYVLYYIIVFRLIYIILRAKRINYYGEVKVYKQNALIFLLILALFLGGTVEISEGSKIIGII